MSGRVYEIHRDRDRSVRCLVAEYDEQLDATTMTPLQAVTLWGLPPFGFDVGRISSATRELARSILADAFNLADPPAAIVEHFERELLAPRQVEPDCVYGLTREAIRYWAGLRSYLGQLESAEVAAVAPRVQPCPRCKGAFCMCFGPLGDPELEVARRPRMGLNITPSGHVFELDEGDVP